ncbi:hypothetical protein Tco_0766717, partial [Tanacetum coccineum]
MENLYFARKMELEIRFLVMQLFGFHQDIQAKLECVVSGNGKSPEQAFHQFSENLAAGRKGQGLGKALIQNIRRTSATQHYLQTKKDKIKQWSNNIKTLERNRKTVALEEINSIEKMIDEGSAMPSDNDHRLILLQEIEKIDKFASMDIIQKAHVKWVMFSNLPHSHSLNCMDRETLERQVTLEEIKEAVWDCGSSKASGADGLLRLRLQGDPSISFPFHLGYGEHPEIGLPRILERNSGPPNFFGGGHQSYHGQEGSFILMVMLQWAFGLTIVGTPIFSTRKVLEDLKALSWKTCQGGSIMNIPDH